MDPIRDEKVPAHKRHDPIIDAARGLTSARSRSWPRPVSQSDTAPLGKRRPVGDPAALARPRHMSAAGAGDRSDKHMTDGSKGQSLVCPSVKLPVAYGEQVEGTPFGRYRLIELFGPRRHGRL